MRANHIHLFDNQLKKKNVSSTFYWFFYCTQFIFPNVSISIYTYIFFLVSLDWFFLMTTYSRKKKFELKPYVCSILTINLNKIHNFNNSWQTPEKSDIKRSRKKKTNKNKKQKSTWILIIQPILLSFHSETDREKNCIYLYVVQFGNQFNFNYFARHLWAIVKNHWIFTRIRFKKNVSNIYQKNYIWMHKI